MIVFLTKTDLLHNLSNLLLLNLPNFLNISLSVILKHLVSSFVNFFSQIPCISFKTKPDMFLTPKPFPTSFILT